MKRICKLCGKEFEPKVHNSYICSDRHYINCRICNKPVPMDGVENKKKRQFYFNNGFVYCSHLCSCKGSGIDKYNSANANVDLERLKYLKTQTPMFDTDIAKELGVSVDFVKDRCKRNSWYKSEELKKEDTIANMLKDTEGGFDVVIECCGNSPAVTSSIVTVKEGGTIVLVGVSLKPIEVPTALIVTKELKVLGAIAYTYEEFNDVINMLANKEISLKEFITDTVSLEGVNEAFERLISGKSKDIKILVDPSK